LVVVPPTVATDTSFNPAVPVGVTAVMDVADTTRLVAGTPSIFTLVAPVKFSPVIVIAVPAERGPDGGLTLVIVGAAIYVNALALVAIPPIVFTEILCVPTLPAGVIAVMDVADATITLVASTPPTVTIVAPVKLLPVIVIVVPPVIGPETGLTDAIVGAGT